MKKLLAVLVFIHACAYCPVNAQIGVQTGLFIFKNTYEPSAQILSSTGTGQTHFQHGIWDSEENIFMPSSPIIYKIDPFSVGGDIENPSKEFGVVFDLHPQHPWFFPTSPLPPNQKIGFQISFTENTGTNPVVYSAVIVFSSNGNYYFDASDEAKIGQVFAHPESGHESTAEGIAYILVPEPSSLSLLLAGGVVLMAGRRIYRSGKITEI